MSHHEKWVVVVILGPIYLIAFALWLNAAVYYYRRRKNGS